jgi:hypothetical protein
VQIEFKQTVKSAAVMQTLLILKQTNYNFAK